MSTIDAGQDVEVEKEAIREEVKKEKEEWVKRDPENWLIRYLNNFETRLPVTTLDKLKRFSMNHRDAAEAEDIMDQPYADFFKDETSGLSRLYLSQTPRQFFATIDQTLVEAGVDIDEIKHLQHGDPDGFPDRESIFRLVEPVYERLREMGYSRPDLTR